MDHSKSHWALLIGINFYLTEKHLNGCVQDVKLMKQYLEAELQSSVQIGTLTASTPSDSKSLVPIEKPEMWPTYKNVISRMEEITSRAKSGDFVYIHYSGHGTRKPVATIRSSGHRDSNKHDLAMVLFDEEKGSRYFWGFDLAKKLKVMVEKGLLVTLVLDCCHSGSSARGSPHVFNDGGVRGIDYDPVIDMRYPPPIEIELTPEIDMELELEHQDIIIFRDVRLQPTWLLKPHGYTILTACGPHEIARELQVECENESENGTQGALSYFLLQALKLPSKMHITFEELYQHIRIDFCMYRPDQIPMRYGNKGLTFFGNRNFGSGMDWIPVFKVYGSNGENDRLILAAGQAHGLSVGDEYDITPWHEDVSDGAPGPLKARLSVVRGLTSDLEASYGMTTNYNNSRFKARLRSHRSPLRIIVDNQSQWEAATTQRLLHPDFLQDVEGRDCDFKVKCNGNGDYEIQDERGQRIESLPVIPAAHEGALDYVLDILDHLSAFMDVKNIRNEDSATKLSWCTIKISEVLTKTSEKELTGDVISVNDGATIRLTVTNIDNNKPIYLHVFSLGESWQIENLLEDDGNGPFEAVPPSYDIEDPNETTIDLDMTIPRSSIDRGYSQCKDVIKVLVTSQPTAVASFTLPRISASDKDTQEPIRINGDEMLKSSLETSLRGKDGGSSDEEWLAQSFTINITRLSGTVA